MTTIDKTSEKDPDIESLFDRNYQNNNYHNLGCGDLLMDMYRLYQNSAPSKLKQLTSLIAGGHLDDASRVAHSLKGESGSIGGKRVMTLAARLEQETRLTDRTNAQDTLRQLEQELDNLLAAIKIELSQNQGETA
jgi:HPt (histidine-containing phosphotransfer) domain-containing protein